MREAVKPLAAPGPAQPVQAPQQGLNPMKTQTLARNAPPPELLFRRPQRAQRGAPQPDGLIHDAVQLSLVIKPRALAQATCDTTQGQVGPGGAHPGVPPRPASPAMSRPPVLRPKAAASPVLWPTITAPFQANSMSARPHGSKREGHRKKSAG